MGVMQEIYDEFNIGKGSIYVSGAVAIIDSVKRILIMSEDIITVEVGKGRISVNGRDLWVEYLSGERMCIKGQFYSVEFL